MSNTFDLILDSKFNEVERATQLIDEIGQQIELDEELKSKMTLAVSEAATNAIMHGNREDENKKVFIHVEADKDQIKITVEDQGEGFNPDNIPSPLEENNLMKTGGRGVFLMEEFADHITYEKNGSKVILTFNR